ncbi:MAG: phosphatase PAP2 family protein [Flavobacteriales bacterium]
MKLKSSLFDWCNYLFWLFALLIIIETDKLSLHVYFNSFSSSIGDFLMPIFTHIGDGLFLLFVALIVFIFKSKKMALILLIAFLVSSGIVQFLKHVIFENHMRPMYVFQHVNNFHQIKDFHYHLFQSFPSGHSTSSFVLFTFFAIYFAKTWWTQILCFLGALFFAFTRVYLSQHYFEDLFAGAMIGFLCMKYATVFLQGSWLSLDQPFKK